MPKRKLSDCESDPLNGLGTRPEFSNVAGVEKVIAAAALCLSSSRVVVTATASTSSSEEEDMGRRNPCSSASMRVTDADETSDSNSSSCTTDGSTNAAARPRSSLKKRAENNTEETVPRKKSIAFNNVTVYYFGRMQGFTCVPSQGGSTLGMANKHNYVQKFTLVEHADEQKKTHREMLLKQRRGGGGGVNGGGEREKDSPSSAPSSPPSTTPVPSVRTSDDELEADEDDDDEEEETDISDSELEADNYYFLQPVPTRQRRAMLRASGIRKIDSGEKDECRDIRTSREFCGCECKIYCDPETCACSQAGIKCQVDRLSFPCGCTRDGCGNLSGRIEFNPIRVRTHFIHTLMRMEIERKQFEHQQHVQQQQQQQHNQLQPMGCMESLMATCQARSPAVATVTAAAGGRLPTQPWLTSTLPGGSKLSHGHNMLLHQQQQHLESPSSSTSAAYFQCDHLSAVACRGHGAECTTDNNSPANGFGVQTFPSAVASTAFHVTTPFESRTPCSTAAAALNMSTMPPSVNSVAASLAANKKATDVQQTPSLSLPRVMLFNDSDDELLGREDSQDMYASSFQEDDSSSYSENSDCSDQSFEAHRRRKAAAAVAAAAAAAAAASVAVQRNQQVPQTFPTPSRFPNYDHHFALSTNYVNGNGGSYNYVSNANSGFDPVTSRYNQNYDPVAANCCHNTYSQDEDGDFSYSNAAADAGTFVEMSSTSSPTDRPPPSEQQSSSLAVPATVTVACVEEPQKYTELSSATCMSKLEPFTEILQAKYRSFENLEGAQCYADLVTKNGDSSSLEPKLANDELDRRTSMDVGNNLEQTTAETTNFISQPSASENLGELGENFGEIIKKTMVETVST